jgi:hypothetical protein
MHPQQGKNVKHIDLLSSKINQEKLKIIADSETEVRDTMYSIRTYSRTG